MKEYIYLFNNVVDERLLASAKRISENPVVVSALCQLTATLARHELARGWPELLQFVMVSS